MIELLTQIKNEEEKIRQGGGAKAIEAQHKKGRLTARERIAKLIDRAIANCSNWASTPLTGCMKNGAARPRRARSPGWGRFPGGA